jgi:hypothetical protein
MARDPEKIRLSKKAMDDAKKKGDDWRKNQRSKYGVRGNRDNPG